MKVLRSSLLIIVSVFFSLQLQAAILTEQQVKNWIASQPDMQAFSKKHEKALDFTGDNAPITSIAEAMKKGLMELKKNDLYGDVNALVKKHGFKDVDQWGDATIRIFNAMLAIQVETPEYAAAKAQMEALANNPDIPAEQKEMMLSMMGPMSHMMEAAKAAPAEDKAMIKLFFEQLKKSFESQQ